VYPLKRSWPNVDLIQRLAGPGLHSPPEEAFGISATEALMRPGNLAIDGQHFQIFNLKINNNAGTLRHKIYGNFDAESYGSWHYKIRRITDATRAYVNTPTVAAGVDFLGGGGIMSGVANTFVFDVARQDPGKFAFMARVDYYSGNVSRPRVYGQSIARNVFGVTMPRIELTFINDMTAAAWNINTTNIPSGTTVGIRCIGFIA